MNRNEHDRAYEIHERAMEEIYDKISKIEFYLEYLEEVLYDSDASGSTKGEIGDLVLKITTLLHEI